MDEVAEEEAVELAKELLSLFFRIGFHFNLKEPVTNFFYSAKRV